MYARYIPPSRPKPAPAAEQASESPADAGDASYPKGIAAPAPPVPSDSFSYARYVPPTGGSAPVRGGEDAKKRKRDGDVDEREGKKVKAAEVAEETAKALETEVEEAAQEVDGDGAAEERTALSEKEERRRRKEEKRAKKEEKQRKKASDEPEPHSAETSTPKKSKKSRDEQTNEEIDADPQDSDVEMTAPADKVPSEPAETKQEKKPKREKKKKHKEADKGEDDDSAARHHKSVLEKKEKALRNLRLPSPVEDAPQPQEEPRDEDQREPEPESHGLKPLPQPKPVAFDTATSAFDGLPPWIAEPIRVEESTRMPFTALGLPEKVARGLDSRGYKEAFAVQTAAIPLLLPTAKQLQGDVLVSAATGSGKTLAYAIPIVRDISSGMVTRLRALVVLPTRELVKQAKEAFESVAVAFDGQGRKRVRIGIAYGSQSLKAEQGSLITREELYDPEAARKAEEDEAGRDALLESDAKRNGAVKGSMPDHVVTFGSTVDVLICTPGRLVDHIRQTAGFDLTYVRWLIVDEGDKLLEQNYQNWLPTVTHALRAASDPAVLGARDFPGSSLSGVRKVFLSATLTSRGSLAAMRELGLQRPRLVVLGGDGGKAEHVLPEKLREFAIRLRDENLKPLYLNELLLSERLRGAPSTSPEPESESESSSDSDSDSDSDASASSKQQAFTSTALIFTKSNESALRLSRLLTHLSPSLTPLLATLTSATPPHVRRRTISQFAARRVRLLVASDLVARGLDLPLLDHVVNYDLPPSVESYVHRVGRTARAGRDGCAWSLVPDGKEGGWFWGEVVKGARIHRAAKVERVLLGEEGEIAEERVEAYEKALAELAKEASGKKARE